MKKEDRWFTVGKDNCFINDVEILYDTEECRHITIKTKYGYHRITKVTLNNMVEIPKSASDLDKNLYWKNRILEKNPDIEIITENLEKGHEFIIEFILYTEDLDNHQLHYIQFYDNIYNTGSKIITTNLVKKPPTKYLKMTNLLTGEQTIGLKTEITNKFPNYGYGVRRVLNGDCKQTQCYTFEYCDEYGN